MRVSEDMTSRSLLGYLQAGKSAVFDLQSQISSGLRVRKPSDDPGSYSLIRGYQKADANARQYMVNAGRLEGKLNVMDSKLQEASDVMHRVSEIVVSGGDSSKSPADREFMADEINQSLESMLALANTTAEGDHVFAGLQTNSPPYVATRDTAGKITAITYQGNMDTRFVEVGNGSYVPTNIPGSDATSKNGVFQSQDSDLFNDLIHIRDRLLAGENLAEDEAATANAGTDELTIEGTYATGGRVRLESTGTLPTGLALNKDYFAIVVGPGQIQLAATLEDARAGIAVDFSDAGTGQLSITQQALADITSDQEQLTFANAKVGAYQERVSFSKKMLAAELLQTAEGVEREGAVDAAKAITELNGRQTAYEAALAVTSKVMNTSLLNYI